MTKQFSLIGVAGWDSFGESALSIVKRIQIANQFTINDIARLFGSKGISTFNSIIGSNPDFNFSLSESKLCPMAGWDLDMLDASYSTFYRWQSSTRGKYNYDEYNNFNISASNLRVLFNIRICPTCASEGLHLVFHQLPELNKCPLHLDSLITICPVCGAEYGVYQYQSLSNDQLLPVTGCAICGFGTNVITKRKKELDQKKNDTINEYRHWIKDVNRCMNGLDSTRYFFGNIKNTRDTGRIHSLLPGPNWIDECVVKPSRMKNTFVQAYVGEYVSSPKHNCSGLPEGKIKPLCMYGMKEYLLMDIFDKASEAADSAKKTLSERVDINSKSGIGFYWNEMNPSGIAGLRCKINTKASASAYGLWESDMSDIREINLFINQINSETMTGRPSLWWGIWREDGPGKLSWLSWLDSFSSEWMNLDLAIEISYKYWEIIFLNLYTYYYCRCTLVFHSNMFDKLDRRYGHAYEANREGFLPIFMIEQSGTKVKLKYSNTIAHLSEFHAHLENDKPGLQQVMSTDFEMQKPIFKLFGVDDSVCQKSRKTIEELKSRIESNIFKN